MWMLRLVILFWAAGIKNKRMVVKEIGKDELGHAHSQRQTYAKV